MCASEEFCVRDKMNDLFSNKSFILTIVLEKNNNREQVTKQESSWHIIQILLRRTPSIKESK